MNRKIGLALGFGLVSLPAGAEGVAGHLELGIGGIHNLNAFNGIIGLFEGAARFNAAFGDGWNLQADFNADTIFINNFSATTNTPAIHFWHGNGNYAAGVVAGASFGGLSGSMHYFAGVEGEAYLTNTAVGGQALYFRAVNNGFNHVTLRGWIDHYINPDLSISGELSAYLPLVSSGANGIWTVDLSVENRISGTAFSGFITGRHQTDFQALKAYTGLVGIRMSVDPEGTTNYGHNMLVPWNVKVWNRILSCFIGETKILMADGSMRPIALVKIGDRVIGEDGAVNTVVDIEVPLLGDRKLYSFNDGPAFVTAEHPFMTRGGWRSIDPAATLAETKHFRVDILQVGDEVVMLTGVATNRQPALAVADDLAPASDRDIAIATAACALEAITDHTGNPLTVVYNLRLDGNHTYFADGYLVHNK